MQEEHNWVSYINTHFSLHSLDSTQNISKTVFDDCSRVDDCHLLWQLRVADVPSSHWNGRFIDSGGRS